MRHIIRLWATGSRLTATARLGFVGSSSSSLPYVRSGFVAELGFNGELLFRRGFGGGLLVEQQPTYGDGFGIAIDAQDAVYVVGRGSLNVPTAPGTLDPIGSSFNYVPVPCIFKLDNVGNVVYGTYLDSGGLIYGVAVDAVGNAYIGANGNGPIGAPGNCGGSPGSTVLILNADASKILASAPVGGQVVAISQNEKGVVTVAGTGRDYGNIRVSGHAERIREALPVWHAAQRFCCENQLYPDRRSYISLSRKCRELARWQKQVRI